MKGYLTVFLALSLSFVTGFILLLTGNAVRKAGKVRLECAVDTGMNAVLSEFHRDLLERYGLLYVDASYLGSQPKIANVENRLRYYVEENTSELLGGRNAPWGALAIEETPVLSFETAAADMGSSMRNQAICYAQDCGLTGSEREILGQMNEVHALEVSDPMEHWIGIMEQLAGMELPVIQNEEGEWEEVALSNPADWVFGLAGSDILYLAKVDAVYISPAKIELQRYISHRQRENTAGIGREYRDEKELFLSYLFDRMGCFGDIKENSLLSCQLEYLAHGKDSDLGNMKSTAEKLLKWRFADNVSRALADGDLRAQALAAAEQLLAVILKAEFKQPVAESILYACAFLESIGDVRTLYEGGAIPLRKSSHQMSVSHVLNGNFYQSGGGQGLTYQQYLAGMILLVGEETLNLRTMDIMEMDIRFRDGNENFCMDWCIERLEAQIVSRSSGSNKYTIRRKYGYF